MNWITLDEDRCLKYAGKRTVSLVDDDDDKDLKSVNIVHAATACSVHLIKKKKKKTESLVCPPSSFVLFKSHSNH